MCVSTIEAAGFRFNVDNDQTDYNDGSKDKSETTATSSTSTSNSKNEISDTKEVDDNKALPSVDSKISQPDKIEESDQKKS